MDEIDWERLAADLPVITEVDALTFRQLSSIARHPSSQSVAPEKLNRLLN